MNIKTTEHVGRNEWQRIAPREPRRNLCPPAAATRVTNKHFPVMAGHSRSKNGVASLAYVAGIHVFKAAQ